MEDVPKKINATEPEKTACVLWNDTGRDYFYAACAPVSASLRDRARALKQGIEPPERAMIAKQSFLDTTAEALASSMRTGLCCT